MMNLFSPIVPCNRFHPNFAKMLLPVSEPVRQVLQLWVEGFSDRDGKFIKEFQTSFNSSFWEIYLYAVLKHLEIDVDFTHQSPDFVCTSKNLTIEAVIASNAIDEKAEWNRALEDFPGKDSWQTYASAAIRLSNAIHSKLIRYREHYKNLAHCEDKAYIIAIGNYSATDFFFQGDVPLQWLLYDVLNLKFLEKKSGGKVELGLFRSEAFSDVSAVLYSSVATTGKARALSNDFTSIFHAIRIHGDEIVEIVGSKPKYNETLCDGLRLFINPFAKQQISLEHFNDNDIRTLIADDIGNYKHSLNHNGHLLGRFVQIFK